MLEEVKFEHKESDPNMTLSLSEKAHASPAMPEDVTDKVVTLLRLLPGRPGGYQPGLPRPAHLFFQPRDH